MNERLWEAARLDHAKEVLELLKFEIYGDLIAQVNSKGLNDWTALHIAAHEGSTDVVCALVHSAEETDLEAITVLYQTPLHLAAAKGYLDIVQILVAAGAQVDAQDYTGCTPLHIIAKNNHIETGAWLLGRDPNVLLKNEAGKTAYEESSSRDMAEVFEIYYQQRGIQYQKIALLETSQNETEAKDQIDRTLLKAQKGRQQPALNAFMHLLKKPISELINESQRRKNSGPDDSSALAAVSPDSFEVKSRIGKGAFGEVFLVVKKDTAEIFAMKVIDKSMVRQEKLLKYVITERNILTYVSHPFIVGLHYAFQTPQKLILILDYCPGGDLGSLIAREKRLSEEVARVHISEVILALEELHARKILYRDLKPENVLLDYQGHAILTDFGLSKENVQDDEVAESFCGSQLYLAPEVLSQTGHHKSVDWYTLGALLYEMITGTPPYYSRLVKDLFKNIQTAKLQFPRFVSDTAKDLVMRLLNRDPRERLGAGPRGALDIKEHPFFEGVDWAAVLRRQLRPPQPSRTLKKHDELIDPVSVFGDLSAYDPDLSFEGWAYTAPR